MYFSVGLWPVPVDTDDEAILKPNLAFKRDVTKLSDQVRQKRTEVTGDCHGVHNLPF